MDELFLIRRIHRRRFRRDHRRGAFLQAFRGRDRVFFVPAEHGDRDENEDEADVPASGQKRFGISSARPIAPASTGHLLVKPRLRSLVTFNCMNLARPGYIGRFDCIFCMDVLPHFSRAQRIALLERLHLYLEPGGYLFLSQTEKLSAPNLNFRSETFDGYTFHRKPLAASAAYGR